MPPRKGKSASPNKKKEKEATVGVESPSDVEEDHDGVSHSSRVDENPNEFFDSLSPVMGNIGKMIYGISGSTSYTKSFLGLAGKVQNNEDLNTVADALQVVGEVIRMDRMTKEEFCKAMPIPPASNEKPADKAAKFSSELETLSKQLSNNEMPPEVIDEFLAQENCISLLKGAFEASQGSVHLKLFSGHSSKIPLLSRPKICSCRSMESWRGTMQGSSVAIP